jgi:hypothetical protein
MPDGVKTILDISKGHPLFLQLLARRAWQKTESICDKGVVEEALKDELSTSQYEYETRYQCVRTKEQRIVLFSLAMNDSVPFSQESMNRYGIVHPNSLNRAVSQLIVMDFIEKLDRGKYRFTDLFFKEFIRRRML